MSMEILLDEIKELQTHVAKMLKNSNISSQNAFKLKAIKSDLVELKNATFAIKLKNLQNKNTNNTGYTLDEIGLALGGISRERVRQIEMNAIKKLKHPKISIYLHRYTKDL